MMTPTKSERPYLALLALGWAVALLANLGAWKGYFQGDDLDTLSWTRSLPLTEYLKWLALPLYMPTHFRPAGHLVYWLLQRSLGLRFPAYLTALQGLHLVNIVLVWTLLRTLRFRSLPAGLGTLFFSFHAAVIEAYWEPQFLFDVLCATFSLSCLILFARRRFVLSFLCFWLAYKAKELAVMVPFVLAVYEFQLGKRSWKPLAPFLAVGLAFGIQGVVLGKQQHLGTVYALHFTWKALASSTSFYASQIFLVPYLGFAILFTPIVARDRKVWLGIAVCCLFLVPLLPMADRILSVYCYLPLVGVAMVAAALAEPPKGASIVAVFLTLWLPWNYIYSRPGRTLELLSANQNRAYVRAASAATEGEKIVLAGWPMRLEAWGAIGAFRYLHPGIRDLHSYDEPGIGQIMQRNPIVQTWQPATQALTPGVPSRLILLRMADNRTIYQLGSGWGRITDGARWVDGRAQATVYPGTGEFQCVTRLRKWRRGDSIATLAFFADGRPLGTQTFHGTGEQTSNWQLNATPNRPVTIEIQGAPDLGTPSAQIVGMGFFNP